MHFRLMRKKQGGDLEGKVGEMVVRKPREERVLKRRVSDHGGLRVV